MIIYNTAATLSVLSLFIIETQSILRGNNHRNLQGGGFEACGNDSSCFTQRENCVILANGSGECICKEGWVDNNNHCADDLDECLYADPKPCDFPGGYCEDRWPFAGFYACSCETLITVG